MMPARRPHSKSRNGCVRCKRKRIKCDEIRPRCKRCHAVDAECEYAALSCHPNSVSTTSPPSSQADQNIVCDPISPHAVPSDSYSAALAVNCSETFGYLTDFLCVLPQSCHELNLTHLKLMRQYCTSTFRSFDLDGVYTKEWQVIVPEIAEQHPFLMHGILSASALHLAVTSPDHTERIKWRSLCLKYLGPGLSTYISLLGSIKPENCSAFFAFSGIISLFSFGYPIASGMITQPPRGSSQAIDGIIQLITLLRGIHAILHSSSRWLAEGPLCNILNVPHTSAQPQFNHPEDMNRLLEQLYGLNDVLPAEAPEQRATLNQAIGRLWTILYLLHLKPERPSVLMQWPLGVDDDYVMLLKARNPMALIVLAYWGTTFKHINNTWAFSGWGAYLVDAVCSISDDRFSQILEWPREQVGLCVTNS